MNEFGGKVIACPSNVSVTNYIRKDVHIEEDNLVAFGYFLKQNTGNLPWYIGCTA
jgi:hypothetical protein